MKEVDLTTLLDAHSKSVGPWPCASAICTSKDAQAPYTGTSKTLNHHLCATMADPTLSERSSQFTSPPPTLSASASKERHFQTHPSFWPYLVPIKISWWYLKRFKNYRTDKHTHKQTLMKTIPPSLHCRSTGGRNTKSLQTYKSIGYAMLCYSLIKT